MCTGLNRRRRPGVERCFNVCGTLINSLFSRSRTLYDCTNSRGTVRSTVGGTLRMVLSEEPLVVLCVWTYSRYRRWYYVDVVVVLGTILFKWYLVLGSVHFKCSKYHQVYSESMIMTRVNIRFTQYGYSSHHQQHPLHPPHHQYPLNPPHHWHHPQPPSPLTPPSTPLTTNTPSTPLTTDTTLNPPHHQYPPQSPSPPTAPPTPPSTPLTTNTPSTPLTTDTALKHSTQFVRVLLRCFKAIFTTHKNVRNVSLIFYGSKYENQHLLR